jgi:hypothetical protein
MTMSDTKDNLVEQLIVNAVAKREEAAAANAFTSLDVDKNTLLDFSERPAKYVSEHNYTVRMIERIRSADPMHPGVKLGRLCVTHNIPVRKVSGDLGVSRPTVYGWFTGKQYPNTKYMERVKDLLLTYSALNQ